MPSQELTRSFTQGRMDLSSDSRLIERNTYRRGQNISISRSDNANVGALETVRGNAEIAPGEDLQLNDNYVIIGSVADNNNNRILYFFVGPTTEGIYQLDVSVGEDGTPVDRISRILEFDTSRKIFNFQTSNLITAVNVIDSFLIWNDGLNAPRKVNVDRFNGSGRYYLPSVDRDSRGLPVFTKTDIITTGQTTDIFSSIPANSGITLDLDNISTDREVVLSAILADGLVISVPSVIDQAAGTLTIQASDLIAAGVNITGSTDVIIQANYTYLLTRASVVSDNLNPAARLLSDVNPEYDGEGNPLINFQTDLFSSLNVSQNAPEHQLAFPGDFINLGKRPPAQAPAICAMYDVVKPEVNFDLRDRFIYAATRYRYRDGELTPLSAFSEPIFFPGSYSIQREPASVNSMQNVISRANIVYDAGSEEVTEVEIWITEGLGRPVQNLATIVKKGGYQRPVGQMDNGDLPENGTDIPDSTPYAPSVQTFLYDNNKTYRNLPEDQINYLFSDIPVSAKTQEFVGNRLVMGNYIRNKSLTKISEEGSEITPDFNLAISDRSRVRNSNEVMAAKSIKSDRTVEFGLVYKDFENRSSSVVISRESSLKIPFGDHNQIIKLDAVVSSAAPYWAEFAVPYFKDSIGDYNTILPISVIKDTSNTRAYVRIHPSEVNKIQADTTMVIKATSSDSNPKRAEFKVAPYGQGGFVEATDTTTNFFTPFDTAQSNTNNGFAPIQEANAQETINFVPRQNRYQLQNVPENAQNVVVRSVLLDALTISSDSYTFSPADNSISIFRTTAGVSNIIVNYSYKDDSVPAEEAEDLYFAITPVDEGGLDLLPNYNDSVAVQDRGVIFETLDTSFEALDDVIYYEWGQSFRVVNGAHTTSEAYTVNNSDRIQTLLEEKGTVAVAGVVANSVTAEVNLASTDIPSGTYDLFYTDASGQQVNIREVVYVRRDAASGTLTLPGPADIDSNTILTITDQIPQGKELGDPVDGDEGTVTLPLSYFNCYSYPFGVEEVKIRGEFNAPKLSPGIRSSVVNEDYRRREQSSHLIHSGIFNDDNSLNRLNEFNRFFPIERELEDSDGPITRLLSWNTNLIAFQERKVKNVPINKNLIQDAGGNLSTTTSNNFFNTERAYSGEYGTVNPESVAIYGNRIYFADKNSGALCRLANDGITEISQSGVESYVRENISRSELLTTSYDYNRDQAHITFSSRPEQPAQGSNDGEFVITEDSCPDPRAECNVVDNPSRSAEGLNTKRIYTTQGVRLMGGPLFGLDLGDSVFVNRARTQTFNGNYRWFLLIHEAQGTLGTPGYIPPNNVSIQISPFGSITGIERDCRDNRPVDLPRELFAISADTFSSAQDACANGVIESVAFHDGSGANPVVGNDIYSGRLDLIPSNITGFKLTSRVRTGGIVEKDVIEVVNGRIVFKITCDQVSRGRNAILGSHPILIPFGTSAAARNLILCNAPWAEEVYWFDAETQLPEVGDPLYENDSNDDLVFGPWDSDRSYVNLAAGGQYVKHNNSTWSYSGDGTTNTEPSTSSSDWTRVAGYVMITFNNGYFTAIGGTGSIITYGICSEVRCFSNPDDFIVSTTGSTDPYAFTFSGIDATYSVSSTGVNTTLLDDPIGIRNAEINYVVQGKNRYPATGSLSVNAERSDGTVFYSSLLDSNNTIEQREGRDINFFNLEPASAITLPAPTSDLYALEDVGDVEVQITALCYRGVVNQTSGDILGLIPDAPVLTIEADEPIQEINMNISLDATATDSDGTVDAYQWTLPSGVTLVSGSTLTSEDISITSATAGSYVISLRVTDSNLIPTTENISVTFFDPAAGQPPTVRVGAVPTSQDTGDNVVLSGTITPAGTKTISSYTWTLPSNITLVSGSLTGTSGVVTPITVTSSVETTHTITLMATDSDAIVGQGIVDIDFVSPPAPTPAPYPASIWSTDAAITESTLPTTCGGRSGGQTANNVVYYDPDAETIQLFESQLGSSWTRAAGNYGISTVDPSDAEGGGIVTQIWTITSNGIVTSTTSLSCNVPYSFSLGYTNINTSSAHQTACNAATSTEVYADQPRVNFSSQDANPVNMLSIVTGGSITAAPAGFYTDGTVVRQWTGTNLRANSTAGCSLAKTATLLTGTLPANTRVEVTPSGGTVSGLVGGSYSITATLFPVSGREFVGTPTYSVTGGETLTNQTGNSYTFSGTFGTGANPTATVMFSANTQIPPVPTYSARFTVTENISNASLTFRGSGTQNGSTRTTGGLSAGNGFNMSATLSITNGFELVPGTLRYNGLTTPPSGVTLSGDGLTLTYNGNIDSATPVDVSANVAITGQTRAGATTGSASLTATTSVLPVGSTSVSFSGGSVSGNTVSVSGRATPTPAQEFNLRATLVAETGWLLSSVNQSNPFVHSGTFTTAPQNETVTFTGIAVRPSFSAFSGTTALEACQDTTHSTFYSNTGNLEGATQLYGSSADTTLRTSDIYLRVNDTTVRFWDASAGAFGADTPCSGVTPVFDLVNLRGASTTTNGACALTVDTPGLYSDSVAINSMTTLRTGQFSDSAVAPTGVYSQGSSYRRWNGTSWEATGSCSTRSINGAGGNRRIVTGETAGNDANEVTEIGTISITGASATVRLRFAPNSGDVIVDPRSDFTSRLTIRNSSGVSVLVLDINYSVEGFSGVTTFVRAGTAAMTVNGTLPVGEYTYTWDVDNDLILSASFANAERLRVALDLAIT